MADSGGCHVRVSCLMDCSHTLFLDPVSLNGLYLTESVSSVSVKVMSLPIVAVCVVYLFTILEIVAVVKNTFLALVR